MGRQVLMSRPLQMLAYDMGFANEFTYRLYFWCWNNTSDYFEATLARLIF